MGVDQNASVKVVIINTMVGTMGLEKNKPDYVKVGLAWFIKNLDQKIIGVIRLDQNATVFVW